MASARPVTFAVVGFGQEAAVRIGGTSYPLEAPWPADPYYNGTVEVPADAKTYNYVIDGKPEPFDRVLGDDVAKTLNEFYGREITYQPMPQFNSAFSDKNGAWTRSSRAEIFDGGYIPTVHFSGANAENYIVTAEDATVDVLFVGPTEAVKYEVHISRRDENKKELRGRASVLLTQSAQLKVEFNGEVFYGRSTIKLRNSEPDATLMREQLYVEMLRAAGAPTIETNKARVYYNKKAYGLLELQDQANNEGFIAELFYGNRGQRPDPLGVPLDCSTGADFTPNGPYDAFQQKNEERSETNSRVALLSKALAGLDVTSEAAIAEFNKSSFDIDSFFKAMAMEYLAGHWDSYCECGRWPDRSPPFARGYS
ncbi:MAG: coth protein-domain-containing protein [Olpidium bornovanus]|uniref:Coth protein-domain-containing protein n=1 Tax=Olpidium bornovanus TaxID=278681 RepID=A0A8H7ZLP3_9FUNG|nr:MAG: coth protein-domain-containing protein [Olpidium bornovanus]